MTEKKNLVSPSILSGDFAAMGDVVRSLEKWGADMVHCDVMDGMFVPNISFGAEMIRALRRSTTLPLDVHLMVEKPERYIEEFAKAGSDIITVHEEATVHLQRTLAMIRSLGKKAGVALNPSTDVASLKYVLEDVDMILLMSVNPGFSGQKFIPASKRKLAELKAMLDAAGVSPMVEMDGGANENNAAELAALGANVFVAGNAVFSAKDPAYVIKKMQG